jgi:hypothetical protein
MDQLRYEEELAKLPKRNVKRDEFRRLALLHWREQKTVDLFLKAPSIKDYVKVGKEGLRIAD